MSAATSGDYGGTDPGCRCAHPGYKTTQRRRNKKGGRSGRLFHVISIASSAAVAADHRAHGLVGSEILGAIDIEQRGEFRAGAVDAALDGADRAAADGGGILIGEAGG